MSRATPRLLRIMRYLCLAYIVLVLALSLIPSGTIPVGGGSDKLKHFLAYAAMAGSVLLSLNPTGIFDGSSRRAMRWREPATAVVISNTIGLAIECLQPITGRTFDPADMLANLAGSVLGAAAAVVLIGVCQRLFRRRVMAT